MQLFSIPPAFALIFLLSVIYGTLFHLWRGKTWSDLLLSLLAALAGMVFGQIIGPLLGLDLLRIGQVYILEGTVLAWLLMLAIDLLRG